MDSVFLTSLHSVICSSLASCRKGLQNGPWFGGQGLYNHPAIHKDWILHIHKMKELLDFRVFFYHDSSASVKGSQEHQVFLLKGVVIILATTFAYHMIYTSSCLPRDKSRLLVKCCENCLWKLFISVLKPLAWLAIHWLTQGGWENDYTIWKMDSLLTITWINSAHFLAANNGLPDEEGSQGKSFSLGHKQGTILTFTDLIPDESNSIVPNLPMPS